MSPNVFRRGLKADSTILSCLYMSKWSLNVYKKARELSLRADYLQIYFIEPLKVVSMVPLSSV